MSDPPPLNSLRTHAHFDCSCSLSRFPPHRRASGSASFFTAYEDDAEISDGDESDNSPSTDTSSSGDSTSESTSFVMRLSIQKSAADSRSLFDSSAGTVLPTSKAVLQHSTFSAVLDRYRLLRPSEIFCGDGAAVKVEVSLPSSLFLPLLFADFLAL